MVLHEGVWSHGRGVVSHEGVWSHMRGCGLMIRQGFQ